MPTRLIIANQWIEQIAKAQGINYDRVSRVIIDAKVGEPVFMYITQYGDDGILALRPPEVLEAEIVEESA
jgi:hypothetical protein